MHARVPEPLQLRVPLSRRLREGTRQAHRTVESLAFIRSFLRGVVDHESYLRMLVDLHQVYLQLESWLADPEVPPQLRSLFPRELWRSSSLEQDQAYHARRICSGAEPRSLCPRPSQAALVYAGHLRQLRRQQPLLLISHAYTRYLGDLSGGQILRRIAARALGITGSEGLLFYDFPAIPDCESFKGEFRARLDALPLDEESMERIVGEARLAFAMNGAIYEELQGSAWGGLRSLFRGA
jgi:heme oxygenase